jgi:benzoyl-CoA reductase/2-hydroxyglutaryl-CoA dehydratase subunit BcrC/BadD/HgdB
VDQSKADHRHCSSTPRASLTEISDSLAWFQDMVRHALDYAVEQKGQGRNIVGIMCEFTPRELIMAAGGIPVCMCGGSFDTISAAEAKLPTNLCPLIKSTFGYSERKANPFLEMADLLIAETTCDGKKKMYEILAESRPMHVLELPQKPDDETAFEHWLNELWTLRKNLEARFDTCVTDDGLRAAIRMMNRERSVRRGLAAHMKQACPRLTGRQLLDLKSLISCIPSDLAKYDEVLATLEHAGPDPAGARDVRVLLTGVPLAHGAERVMDIVEGAGGRVVCQESCTGLKPILDDIDASAPDPMRAIAEKYFHLPCSVMTSNHRRIELLSKLVEEFRPQCIIDIVWRACLTYDVEAYRVKRLADSLGLPYLAIETDYSPNDSARIVLRVEALFETLRAAR